MENYEANNQSRLELVTIKSNNKSNIEIKDPKVCREECADKPCTYYCPTRVYTWKEDEQVIEMDHEQCIECLACPYGCPYNNIAWQYPQGNYGVDYTAADNQEQFSH